MTGSVIVTAARCVRVASHKSVARGDPGGACKPSALRLDAIAKNDEAEVAVAGASSFSKSESSSKMRCWLLLRSCQYMVKLLQKTLHEAPVRVRVHGQGVARVDCVVGAGGCLRYIIMPTIIVTPPTHTLEMPIMRPTVCVP